MEGSEECRGEGITMDLDGQQENWSYDTTCSPYAENCQSTRKTSTMKSDNNGFIIILTKSHYS